MLALEGVRLPAELLEVALDHASLRVPTARRGAGGGRGAAVADRRRVLLSGRRRRSRGRRVGRHGADRAAARCAGRGDDRGDHGFGPARRRPRAATSGQSPRRWSSTTSPASRWSMPGQLRRPRLPTPDADRPPGRAGRRLRPHGWLHEGNPRRAARGRGAGHATALAPPVRGSSSA